jgi:sterol desaturase/sphingolipid hydroxylase (fatty acid hydroxylase superfamily)
MAKREKYKSIQVFENPFLERLTHVHPIVPLLVWVPVVAFIFYRSVTVHELAATPILIVAAIGFFSWTLVEYLLHRYTFHFNAVSPLEKRIEFLIHGLHHADPVDPTRLVMPPAGGAILGVILYSLFRLLLGAVWVDPFFAGFLIGYLCYDYAHYSIHHFTPRTRYGKMLKSHHMQHHFVAPNSRWGVSSPFWDVIFGTLVVRPSAKRPAYAPVAERVPRPAHADPRHRAQPAAREESSAESAFEQPV